jgi:hypothetical protein
MTQGHPTPVRIGLMDQRRPEAVTTLPVRHLRWFERLWRATRRGFGVMGLLLLVGNFALLIFPVPHLHLCLFPIAFVLGPVLGIFSWRDRVLLPKAALPCPRCRDTVSVPDELGGWPARFNCSQCGIMIELNHA